MDYCAPRGIRYADFLEWDPLSRDAALAWSQRKSSTCGGCGMVPADSKRYDSDGEPIRDEHGHHVEAFPPRYVVQETWCPTCKALADKRNVTSPPGVVHVFAPNPDAGPLYEPDASTPDP